MIEEGQFLYFIPPKLIGEQTELKKRFMLVINNDLENNNIEMLNVSSIKNKEKKLLFDSNIEIEDRNPLPVPTFAKLDTLYEIDNFNELEKYIDFNGKKLSKQQLAIIKNERFKYLNNNCSKFFNINFTEKNFKAFNQ